jgi:hypothetical protein
LLVLACLLPSICSHHCWLAPTCLFPPTCFCHCRLVFAYFCHCHLFVFACFCLFLSLLFTCFCLFLSSRLYIPACFHHCRSSILVCSCVTTLALGSRPRRRFAKARAKRECEDKDSHSQVSSHFGSWSEASLSSLLNPLEGLSILNWRKLELESRSRLPALKGVKGAC